MNPEPESFTEQLSRLKQMARDRGETWDLSDNDQAAIKAVLNSHDAMLRILKAWRTHPLADLDAITDAAIAHAEGRP